MQTSNLKIDTVTYFSLENFSVDALKCKGDYFLYSGFQDKTKLINYDGLSFNQ